MNDTPDCLLDRLPPATTKANEPRFLFVLGIMQRSGTTYLGRILAQHPDLCRPDGHLELPLLEVADRFTEFHSSFVSLRKDGRLDYSFAEFAEAFGAGLLKLMWGRVPKSERPFSYIFHNNPGTQGIQYLWKFFPGAKVVFLVRDGRDNVNSLMAAHGFRRGRWGLRRSYAFYRFAKAWATSARRILNVVNGAPGDCLLIKYEDLLRDTESQLSRLSDHLEIPFDSRWAAAAKSLPVKGSNFYGEQAQEVADAAVSTCWAEVPKTQAFQPVGRWRDSWTRADRFLFNRVAGAELRAFGYR